MNADADVRVDIVMADEQVVSIELNVRTALRWHRAFEDALTEYTRANREEIEAEIAERASP